MAQRPVFIPSDDLDLLVETKYVEFKWYPGMSVTQKQKSLISLHESARKNIGIEPLLEISSKSNIGLGIQLSAFNLKYNSRMGIVNPVEVFFQGSKVFENGGPFTDLYNSNSRAAKKDDRIRTSGRLIRFVFEGKEWPLDPKTMFYDWLYINALDQNRNLADELTDYAGFTDIEFNPEKSINCQAYSAALYISLKRGGILKKGLEDIDEYISIVTKKRRAKSIPTQGTLF